MFGINCCKIFFCCRSSASQVFDPKEAAYKKEKARICYEFVSKLKEMCEESSGLLHEVGVFRLSGDNTEARRLFNSANPITYLMGEEIEINDCVSYIKMALKETDAKIFPEPIAGMLRSPGFDCVSAFSILVSDPRPEFAFCRDMLYLGVKVNQDSSTTKMTFVSLAIAIYMNQFNETDVTEKNKKPISPAEIASIVKGLQETKGRVVELLERFKEHFSPETTSHALVPQ